MANSVTPLTIQGRYFWKGNERFIINGIVYDGHARCVDMMVDDYIEDLEHAITLLKELRINTLYIHHIDESKSHKACMNLLAEHEIYVLVSIGSCFCTGRHTMNMPYASNTMHLLFQAVEKLASCPNLLGFAIPSNIIKGLEPEVSGPVVRSIVRDTRRYLGLLAAKKHQRVVPVGILSYDKRPHLRHQFDYYCSGDDNETADFFFFNNFICNAQTGTIESRKYQKLIEMFYDTHVPVSFTYGDAGPSPRRFHDTPAIYSQPDMLRIFSGGIVFQFFDRPGVSGIVRRLTGPKDSRLYHQRTVDYQNLHKALNATFGMLPPSILARSRLIEAAAMSGMKPIWPNPTEFVLPMGQVPASLVNWTEVETQVIDDSEWVDAGKEWLDLSVEDLATSMWDRLNIDEADS